MSFWDSNFGYPRQNSTLPSGVGQFSGHGGVPRQAPHEEIDR